MLNALTGDALLDMIRKMEDADRSTQCLTCGYVRENGKPAFTAFFAVSYTHLRAHET